MPPRPQLRSTWAALAVALFLASAGNLRLWRALTGETAVLSWPGLAAVFLVLLAVLDLLLQLVAWRWTFKPLAVTALLASSVATYAMLGYGVLIDRSMIRNALETDAAEAGELFTLRGLAWVSVLGLLPAALLLWTRIRYAPLLPELRLRAAVVGLTLAAAVGTGVPAIQELSFTIRQHSGLKLMHNPIAPLGAVIAYVHGRPQRGADDLERIAPDATRPGWPALAELASVGTARRRQVFVLVLGETARADHFALNGYARDTNPELSTRDVISFADVTACGTSTAEVLPCLFSGLEREECQDGQAAARENLLDLLQRLGVAVLWIDNNSGCKGVCARVPFEEVVGPPELANADGFYDEALLVGLQQRLERQPGDVFIVLHQRGSHGPAYAERSPPAFKRFLPECAADDVQLCPREELINAYDNTIVYTDHVLAGVIDVLQAASAAADVALLYVSDHGESLGENGIYLHGFPYWLAPQEQTRVPMIFWASREFYAQRGLRPDDLRAARGRAYRHEHLFHTLLGVFGVQTSAYDASLDLFATAQG